MDESQLNCAPIGVANRTVIAGKQTRENVEIRKGQRLRIAGCATLLRCLVMAGLLLALGPIPARADDFQELHRGDRGEDQDVRAEIRALRDQIESLRAAVAALKSLVKTLQTGGDTTTLQNEISSLQASNTALQRQLAAVQSNPALGLGPYVSVHPDGELDLAGPHIFFSGANIHIVSGSNSTYDQSGLGNLIIGYNEFPNDPPSGPHQRFGAHNLVIGPGHRYTGDGGLIAGRQNTISGQGATVTGGSGNVASGDVASVSGGAENLASGANASVSGGGDNTASDLSSVSGGNNNTASGLFSTVCSGENNLASGLGASVSGGAGNTGGGRDMVIIGGQNVNDFIDFTIQPKAPFP